VAVRPVHMFRIMCYDLVKDNSNFEIFIIVGISLNTITLMLPYDGMSEEFQNALNNINMAFVIFFIGEAVIKLSAFGFKYYWHETWNKFDLFIVIVSLVSLNTTLETMNITALRIIRVARLLRMIRASKGLRNLLKTLYLALENIINVGTLLLLIIFTFAVAGMDIFGEMPFSENITNNANFTTFYQAMTILIRTSTGELWNVIMIECYENVGFISLVYWVTFVILTQFVFINIFVAVIYEAYNDIKSSEDKNEVLSLKRKDIKNFINAWAFFNEDGNHYMKTTRFPAFLLELPPPLGYEGIKIEPSKLNKIIFCLNIRDH